MDDKDFEGMTVKDALEELRRELGEDQQFLAQYLLSPDPDDEAAEKARVQDVLKIAAAVDDILGHFLEDMEDVPEEEQETGDEPLQMTYNTHAVGVPDDDADNIESDWTIDSHEEDGEEEPAPFFASKDKKKDKKAKKSKKSKKDKKEKKNKKSKKNKKNKK